MVPEQDSTEWEFWMRVRAAVLRCLGVRGSSSSNSSSFGAAYFSGQAPPLAAG